MPVTCLVVGCGSRSNRDDVKFFSLPAVLSHKFVTDKNELSRRRRALWIAAIKRDDLTESKLKNQRVCSKHFITGKPAALEDKDHPDWVPSQEMGHKSQKIHRKQADVERSGRLDKRRKLSTHTLFVDVFLQNNRLDHVSQVMGYHPSYLDHFLKTQNFILRGDGPLPYDYRHFIAIMAAGRHQCSYLISLQKQEFLLQGGDPNWLKGLNHIPAKLRNLNDINKVLAHRPWLLSKTHIEKLTKGNDSWSLAELIHAIVILTHFHSLSSFVFSCGLNQELDYVAEYQSYNENTVPNSMTKNNGVKTKPKNIPIVDTDIAWKPCGPATPPSPTEPEVAISTLMQRMKSLSERPRACRPEEMAERFERIESQSAEIGAVGPAPATAPAGDVGRYVDDAAFAYVDFAKRGETRDAPTFRVQDYSWDDHGYSLVNRLYSDVGNLLDDKFRTAYNLTYYTMGGRKDVDTSRFRMAIWYYIQCLFGIRHDDYDYGEINALLERSLKTFIKSATCYPNRVTKKDYEKVLREFHHSEKVHVNLMVLESRMQAELLYALRTVNRYMTN